MKVAIVSDAWGQVNGVVRTLEYISAELTQMGHEIQIIGPDRFMSVPMPLYKGVRLSVYARRRLARILDCFAPDAIHLPVEGPLGFAGRAYCRRRGFDFSSAYHTRFPEYLHEYTGLPDQLGWMHVRRFHRRSAAVMVATNGVEETLRARGFQNLVRVSRGVDFELFKPRPKGRLGLRRPIWLSVGRVAREKNLDAFLSLELPGSKVVVGAGPQLEYLRLNYPGVHFLGEHTGEDLAEIYADCDYFVFPSLTDTFGLVILEALASGLPVAAYPSARDVITSAKVGCLNEDLRKACMGLIGLQSEDCCAFARQFSWRKPAEEFLAALVPCKGTSVSHLARSA